MTRNAPKQERAWLRLAPIFFCAMVAVLPMAVQGNSCGHDFDFHLQSWMEVAHQWRQGVLWPQWIDSANYGAGEPRLVFYPPISWLMGAMLGSLLPWSAAPVVYTFLALAACGLASYALVREWTPESAPLAAIAAIANPYALFVAYERGAQAELLAGACLPLVALFALRRKPSALPLALTIGAAWLTNAPAAVMACYTLAFLAMAAALVERELWPIWRAAAGAVLGTALAGFYLLPAAYERRWVQIDRAIGSDMRVEDSFLFHVSGEAFHDQVLRTASWIAVILLAASVAAIWAARRGLHSTVRRRAGWALGALVVVIAALQLPASDVVWRHAPELKFLQFPWRWLLVVVASLVWFLGVALTPKPSAPGRRRKRVWITAAALSIAVVVVSICVPLYRQPCDEEDAVSAQVSTFRSGAGFEGTDEYTPGDADNGAIPRGLPPVRVLSAFDGESADGSHEESPDEPVEWAAEPAAEIPANVTVAVWNTTERRIRLQSEQPGFAVLRLLDYPAWRVTVNGVRLDHRPWRADGLLTVPVTAGDTTVEVHYAVTADRDWGLALSAVALAALLVAQRRRRAQAIGYHE